MTRRLLVLVLTLAAVSPAAAQTPTLPPDVVATVLKGVRKRIIHILHARTQQRALDRGTIVD